MKVLDSIATDDASSINCLSAVLDTVMYCTSNKQIYNHLLLN